MNVVCKLTSHPDEKCETILNEWWCVSLHSGCRSQCNGRMIVVVFVLPCASRDAGLQPDVAKRIVMAAWMLHGLRFGRKPGQETVCFFG